MGSSSMSSAYGRTIKLLLIGDSGVGKSSLLQRYAADEWHAKFVSTIGIDFKVQRMEVAGEKVKLQIWDTAGQERFRNITQAYYRGAMGIFVCFDLTDDLSFKNVQRWMKSIEQFSNDQVQIMLVGAKSDMQEKRMVTTAEAESLAAHYHINYFETSAKVNANVQEVFTAMAHAVCNATSADGHGVKKDNPTKGVVVLGESGTGTGTSQQKAFVCCRS